MRTTLAANPSFDTARLSVLELASENCFSPSEAFLDCIQRVLTPEVVAHLPNYFKGVNSRGQAELWLGAIMADSRLFALLDSDNDQLIGFLFVHESDGGEANIGYLFEQSSWGKGFATELLNGLIEWNTRTQQWQRILGGVELENAASSRALIKAGFEPAGEPEDDRQMYQYKA